MTVPEQLLHYIFQLYSTAMSLLQQLPPHKFLGVSDDKTVQMANRIFSQTSSLKPHRFSDAGAFIRAGTHVTTVWSWWSRIALLNN
jgi:hypothetical protein